MDGRAEYKVDSGKLLRADVTFGDRFEHVTLHGDFFVYPEQALDRIEAAVEDMDVDASSEEIAERIATAAGDAALVGFDAADVAQVVREAVGDDG
ncbi:MAG: hypothetical protein SVW77_00855 [Candidatus Nanohaloarchaea archaeon]|nr:hypothetical protein [Candidatus Nanohaloarchaea archaeon]